MKKGQEKIQTEIEGRGKRSCEATGLSIKRKVEQKTREMSQRMLLGYLWAKLEGRFEAEPEREEKEEKKVVVTC